jgi:hypothetical protein
MTATTSKKQQKALNTAKRTLDIQHSQKLSQIREFEEKQKELRDLIKETNKKIEAFNQQKKLQGLCDREFDEYISYVDKRDELQKEIDVIKDKIDETDYYVNVGHTLFKYYDIVEKGDGDDDGVNNINVGENSILKYFIKSHEHDTNSATTDAISVNNDVEEDMETKKDARDDRASLLDRYLSATDENYISPLCFETKECCKYCGSSNMKMLPHDGITYCGECSSIELVSLEHERPSYHQANYEISYFSYKRMVYLRLRMYVVCYIHTT